jgi:hypothetical protein
VVVFTLKKNLKNMVITKIYGGLGNQLFQYYFGKLYSLKTKQDFYLDLTWFEKSDQEFMNVNETKRIFLLNKFDLQYNIAEKSLLQIDSNIINKILSKLKLYNKYTYIIEEKLFAYQMLSYKEKVIIDGYWQNPNYYLEFKDYIKSNLTLNEKNSYPISLNDLVNHKNTLSVHVRRGDYLNNSIVNKIHGICSDDYFINSIEYFKNIFKIEKIVWFSDSNIDETFMPLKINKKIENIFIYNYNLTDFQELDLLRNSKNIILSNSSFSWWGAFSNLNNETNVICPSPWFTDQFSNNIFLNNWVKINKN